MTFKTFAGEHPYLSAIWFLVVVVCIVLGIGALNVYFLVGSLVQVAIVDGLLAISGIILLTRLGWWERAGYTSWIRWRDLPLFILPLAVALLSFSEGISVTAPLTLLSFAALTFVVGFAEETFFRGLILTTLIPAGTVRAVIVSSFFFAAPHLLNSIGGIWDPAFTVVDSIAAFGLGVTFAALRLRTGSIWPLVGVHALFDFTSLVAIGSVVVHAQSVQTLASSVVIGFVFALYGLFLIRGSKNPDNLPAEK